MPIETLDRLRGRGVARFASGLHVQVDYGLAILRELLVPRPGDPPLPGMLDVQAEVPLAMSRLTMEDLAEPFELELEDGRRFHLVIGKGGRLRLSDIGDLRTAYG